MSNNIDSKTTDEVVHNEKDINQVERTTSYDEKARMAEYKAGAIEAENLEHNMGVLQAVRQYPMATFWAFVMSTTIVSLLPLL
jgi:SP family general alpha glucoside:H+ symporter-like MFS transporter